MARQTRQGAAAPPGSTSGVPPTGGETESARLTRAFLLVAIVTLVGTAGFVEIEGWSLWQAFYFTLITITTVGYGDEGLSDAGKQFATVLLVGGVSSASYAFAMIVQASVAAQLAWRKRMNKQIRRLKRHTIVCGFGRLGRSVCEQLTARGAPFVVIERDPERVAQAVQRGYLVLEGTASEDGTLQSAGLARASHVVAAIASFAENIVIAMEVREASSEVVVIARAEREADAIKLERAGVSRVLCPFQGGAREVANRITSPRVADFLAQAAMGDGEVALAEVRVGEGSPLIGLTLAELGRTQADRLSFVALEREGEPTRIPAGGDSVLAAGDRLIVAGDPEQAARATELSGPRSAAA